MTTDRFPIEKIQIPSRIIPEINQALFVDGIQVIEELKAVIGKYGSPEEINAKAHQSRELPIIYSKLAGIRPEYVEQLHWLENARDENRFIGMKAYRKACLGGSLSADIDESNPVTMEISACQYFPWFVEMAERAIDDQMIMPARIIRVRNMKEQEADGDLLAFVAANQIIGASCVEQLDTRGSDGSNIHLGGLDTLIGYYGGVGEPNDYPLKWADEFLYYYTNYGVNQILNVNAGTVLVGYLLYKLGIDIQFKISVTLGNDNPFSAMWTLLTAKLFSREDGSTPLEGFNWSNSVTPETIRKSHELRQRLGFADRVRFEHHVSETWKGLVIQPYNRRQDVIDLAHSVPNISAKHEGGDPEVEMTRDRPSDIQDYFREKDEIIAAGEWDFLRINFMDKFESMNRTALELTKTGLAFQAARNLHH